MWNCCSLAFFPFSCTVLYSVSCLLFKVFTPKTYNNDLVKSVYSNHELIIKSTNLTISWTTLFAAHFENNQTFSLWWEKCQILKYSLFGLSISKLLLMIIIITKTTTTTIIIITTTTTIYPSLKTGFSF